MPGLIWSSSEGDWLLAVEAELQALRAAYVAIGAGQVQAWPYLNVAAEKLISIAAEAHQKVSSATLALDRSCDIAVGAMVNYHEQVLTAGNLADIVGEIDKTIDELWED